MIWKAYLDHAYATFDANLKIDVIYALYLESFCDKNLAIRKVFAFCDSAPHTDSEVLSQYQPLLSYTDN